MERNVNRKNTFSAISINRITAERFREYSKTVAKSHSETIDTMIDFFEKANITPKSQVIISFIKYQVYLNGRWDYIEQLLRDQERKYLKPTHDMLKRLFDGVAPVRKEKQQPLLLDRNSIRMTKAEWRMEEEVVPLAKYNEAVKGRDEDRKRFREVLREIALVEPTFGKSYFRVEMGADELERLKREYLGRHIY
ncbi:BfmA/BtgA family mobilization protein [uncultured Roseivirga sp.]|uniref:BfmA/BtgA family mobilization protein n=1 Tax=uncultured Roseivirga sp. TaxID=543088 RepID=UPI0030D8825F